MRYIAENRGLTMIINSNSLGHKVVFKSIRGDLIINNINSQKDAKLISVVTEICKLPMLGRH